MLVKEAMNRNVKVIRKDSNAREAAEIMERNHIGSLVVVSGAGEIIGIITESDILRDVVAQGKNPEDIFVKGIMSTELITIGPDESLEDAASLMTKHKIKKLPVVQEGRLVGIITASDLISYEKELIKQISSLISHSPMKGVAG